MLLSTTPTIEGKVPIAYLGVIGAEVIFGAWFWKDVGAQIADIIGGRNKDYEKVFADARTEALKQLGEQATSRGANAVLNVRFDYSVLGEKNGMLMVAVTGTAVLLTLTEAEKAREAARDKAGAIAYLVQIDGRQRGPFSIDQLRELLASGRIQPHSLTYDEANKIGPMVSELLAGSD